MTGGFLYLISLIITATWAFSHVFNAGEEIDSVSGCRMLFYNAENLFDTVDDSLTEDDDFLPAGRMRWNYTRYRTKINALYKVIAAAGDPEPPAIIGLCEIENRNVLETLILNTYLSHYNYGIVHGESNDPRGIDVGIIYRNNILSLSCSKQLIPGAYKHDEFRSRNVLYAKFIFHDDTIHLFLNHWPSRRGGVLAGEEYRRNISLMIREKADSINRSVQGKGKIIVAGDFNCSPDDKEILLLSDRNNKNHGLLVFENLSGKLAQKGKGTYKYRGSWEMLDQVLVSESMLTDTSGLNTDKELFRIFSPDFLLTGDPAYPGSKPFATYNGFRYMGGFSDHLPVIVDLRFNQRNH